MMFGQKNQLVRRTALKLASVALLATLAACTPKGGAKSAFELPTDIAEGSKDAKVVLVEYASVTCPHCAAFHTGQLGTIKSRYVEPGLVRYVFREFPTGPVEVASAGHLLRRCVAADKREGVLDALMRGQYDIVTSASSPSGVKPALLTIARAAGMSEADFDKCMSNSDLLKTLIDVRQSGIDAGVTGTPTFFINGVKFEAPIGHEVTADDVGAAIDAALSAAGVTPPAHTAAAPATETPKEEAK